MELTSLPDTILNHIYLYLTHKEIICLSKLAEQFARVLKQLSISIRPPDYQYAREIAAMEQFLRKILYAGEKFTPEDNWFVPPGFQIDSLLSIYKNSEEQKANKTGFFSLVLYAVGNNEGIQRWCRIHSNKVRILVTIGRNDIDTSAIIQFQSNASAFIHEDVHLHEFDPNSTWIGIVGGVLGKIVSGAIEAAKEVAAKRQLGEDETQQISIENLQGAIRKYFPKKMKSFNSEKLLEENGRTFLTITDILAIFYAKYPNCYFDDNLNVATFISKFLNFVAFDILNMTGEDAIVEKLEEGHSLKNPFSVVSVDPEYHEIAQHHLKASESENKKWLLNLELLGTLEDEKDGLFKIVTEPINLQINRMQCNKRTLISEAHYENTDDIEGVLVVDNLIDYQVRTSLLETVRGAKVEPLFTSFVDESPRRIIQELLADFDFDIRKWRFQNEILGLPKKENELFYNNMEILLTRCVPYFECMKEYNAEKAVNKIKPFPLKGKTLQLVCEIVKSNNGYLSDIPRIYKSDAIVARAEYVLQMDNDMFSEIRFYRSLTDIETDILKQTPMEILKEGNPCGHTLRKPGQLIMSAQNIKFQYTESERFDNGDPPQLWSIIFWLLKTL